MDSISPFRKHHLGPCSDYNSVMFGGLGPNMDIPRWAVSHQPISLPWIWKGVSTTCGRYTFSSPREHIYIYQSMYNIYTLY